MYNIFMNFNLEGKLKKQGYRIIIGVDEAGRGPLAGPVVACATTVRNDKFLISNVKLNPNKKWNLIRDSKTLSAKQREILFNFIHKNFYVGVGMCNHKTIDRINILQATFLAMRKAVNNLLKANNFKCQMTNDKSMSNVLMSNDKKFKNTKYRIPNTRYIILVDGNKKIPNLNYEQRAIVKGDKKVKSISAASIIAKVTRDCLMRKMDKKYPQYGFAKHKGYGTKIHLQNLKKYGPSSIHRLSFRPIKKA